MTTKIDTDVQTSMTGMHKPTRPIWSTLSKCKLISPLCNSHLVDQNAYIEHHWSSAERVMISGSRSDRLSRAVRPVFTVQSELEVVIWHKIC